MKKAFWLSMIFIVLVSLVVGGCKQDNSQSKTDSETTSAGHPKGIAGPRLLTGEEKEKVIESALKTPEALKQMEKFTQYDVALDWVAIVWENSEVSEWRVINYDWKNDPNFGLSSAGSEFYSEVLINFGDPHKWQVYVAVNPNTGKAIFVQENPFRTGPEPPTTSG